MYQQQRTANRLATGTRRTGCTIVRLEELTDGGELDVRRVCDRVEDKRLMLSSLLAVWLST